MLDSAKRYNKFHRLLKAINPKVFVQLTYPAKFSSPENSLEHLSMLIDYLKAKDNRGIWFQSTQIRGAPYFSIFLTNYIPKDELSKRWYSIVGSNDPRHLAAGVSVCGFQFVKGSDELLRKNILPLSYSAVFKYGTFGCIKAKVLDWL